MFVLFPVSSASADCEKLPIELADTMGLIYTLNSLSLTEETSLINNMLAESGIEGYIESTFVFTISVDHVMGWTEMGQPIYYATITDCYGCILKINEYEVVLTGDIAMEWDEGRENYVGVYREISFDGPLQDYLGVDRLKKLLDAELKTHSG